MSQSFAVFDVDGTLFRSQISVEILRELAREDKLPDVQKEYFYQQYDGWLKTQDRQTFYKKNFEPYYTQYLIGLRQHDYNKAVENLIKRRGEFLFDWTLHEIERHKNAGRVVILVSSSPMEAVGKISHLVGADYYWGWELIFEAGAYMGMAQFEKGATDKTTIVQELIKEHGLTLHDSYGYGDDTSDVKLLEMVQHPAIINGDPLMMHVATEQGWHVVTVENLRDYPTEKLIHE